MPTERMREISDAWEKAKPGTGFFSAKDQERREHKLLNSHIKEMNRRGAEGFNVGWASGPDFIHSKTSKGRLYSEISYHPENKITHEWENEEVAGARPKIAKSRTRGTSSGYMVNRSIKVGKPSNPAPADDNSAAAA